MIDTNMIHDFEKYKDYPHIGIDCIEKETGKLLSYKTVAEDGVISGKYLFTEEHIWSAGHRGRCIRTGRR